MEVVRIRKCNPDGAEFAIADRGKMDELLGYTP
jgi:hypothetical protein